MRLRRRLNFPALVFPGRKLILTTLAISASVAALSEWAHPASLLVNGQRVASDVSPVTVRGREAFVPLRVVGESLGAQVSYDPKSGAIEIACRGDDLRMHAGERTATLNGNRMTFAHAPFELRGRTMVSLSVIERAFGSKVRYDPARGKINVTAPGIIEAGAQEEAP